VQPCLIGDHDDVIVSSVDHSKFKFGRTTSDDGMRHHQSISVIL
jgi:hypothetical protein